MDIQMFKCPCGEFWDEYELLRAQTFSGSNEEPPEYKVSCPNCGADFDDFSEAVLCAECESSDLNWSELMESCRVCDDSGFIVAG